MEGGPTIATPTLEEFLASKLSLQIYRDGSPVFESKASDLTPLIEFMDTPDRPGTKLTIYDKYVGRAAALLMSLISPDMVYAGVISEGGAEQLRSVGIPYEADETVKWLMGVASQGMCGWEKMAMGKTPDQFLTVLRDLKSDAKHREADNHTPIGDEK